MNRYNLANTQDAVTAFFAASTEPISAVVEAGPNWPVMYDWLEALGQQVTLAHPAKVRVIAEAKVKTDRLDSRILAHLLRADLIPAAYVPGAVTREQRRQLRQRVFLVHLASAEKNRIHALVDRHPAFRQTLGTVSDLFGKASRTWLQTVELPARERALLTQDLTVLDALATQIR